MKNFYPTTALPASHKQKCANLLRRLIATRAYTYTTQSMHRASCWMIDAGNAARPFHCAYVRSSRVTHVRNPAPLRAGVIERSFDRCYQRTPPAASPPIASMSTGRQHARITFGLDRLIAIAEPTPHPASDIAPKKMAALKAAIVICGGRRQVSVRRLRATRRSRRATADR